MASAQKAGSKPAFLHFASPNKARFSPRIVRSPVEMSCCVETMLPYRTATSSALRNSMLSVSRRSYGWTPEGQCRPR
ncbi:hypothetical protein BDE02_04G203200 [Populus trichocarpa]|nr:hypothetical protein BDE02_04G203200 [Populus trichocarpa]